MTALTGHDTERMIEIAHESDEISKQQQITLEDQNRISELQKQLAERQNELSERQNEIHSNYATQSEETANIAHEDAQEQIEMAGESAVLSQEQLDQLLKNNEIIQESNTTLDLIKDSNFGIQTNTERTNDILTKISKYLNRLVGLGIQNNNNQQQQTQQQQPTRVGGGGANPIHDKGDIYNTIRVHST